jgi:hypothetical protein
MWDLRLPAGLFFTGLGLVLCIMGLFTHPTQTLLTGVNVNLYSGLGMLIFGGIMLWMAKRAS